MTIAQLPALNAFLNSASAALLIVGYLLIRRRRTRAHRACMIAAFLTSTLFLMSYLTYHYYHGATRFQGQGWMRTVYFGVLITHTILAAVIVPLVLATLYRASRGSFIRHARLARWTLPLWLYVSVTGVVVYLMLYQLYPQPRP
jgi:uncharacterized membrane protein YozB (DUF420 family)